MAMASVTRAMVECKVVIGACWLRNMLPPQGGPPFFMALRNRNELSPGQERHAGEEIMPQTVALPIMRLRANRTVDFSTRHGRSSATRRSLKRPGLPAALRNGCPYRCR